MEVKKLKSVYKLIYSTVYLRFELEDFFKNISQSLEDLPTY